MYILYIERLLHLQHLSNCPEMDSPVNAENAPHGLRTRPYGAQVT